MRHLRLGISKIVMLAAVGMVPREAGAQSTAEETRRLAASDTSLRVVVSVSKRRLWVVSGPSDTLLAGPVAVGSERTLAYGGRRWRFTTPRGVMSVVSKEEDPVWVPPDWHYVEVARRERLSIVWLHADTVIVLSNGDSLVMRNMRVLLAKGSSYEDVGNVDEIVLGNTLFVPPIGSPNRRIMGQLGKYRLLLGGGVGIHGTPEAASVGRAVTHGCMRVHDADLAWLYDHVPVGTPVYVF